MTKALDVIEEFLDWRGWHSVRMDGSTPTEERGQLVEQFNTDSSVFVFLLSTRTGGVGLNLQVADTAIMYDSDFNPQIDLQAQARIHRLGQTKQVSLLYAVASCPASPVGLIPSESTKRVLALICPCILNVYRIYEACENLSIHVFAARGSQLGFLCFSCYSILNQQSQTLRRKGRSLSPQSQSLLLFSLSRLALAWS